jgi:hypothetical protein
MRDIRLIAGLLLAIFSAGPPAAQAEIVGDLYRAQRVVTGTEQAERSRGFREGLEDVVIKLTGDASLAGSDRLAAVLARADSLVARHEYEDRMKDLPVRDEQGTRERPHFLRIWFDAAKVDAALTAAGLEPWPADRPVVTVWLLAELPDRAVFLAREADELAGQHAVLTEAALRRGVPLKLPDRDTIKMSEHAAFLAGGNRMAVMLELMRQSAAGGVLLFGSLEARPDGAWNVRWAFDDRRDGKRLPSRQWASAGVTFDTGLRGGIERTARILSGKDAPERK